jgi:hypothetical protein
MYLTGTANTLDALKSAILDAASQAGWSVSGGTASKNGCNATLDVVLYGTGANPSNALRLMINDAATAFGATVAATGAYGMTLPVIWHFFANGDECYAFFNYNVEMYMYLAWGKSPVSGLPGTGVWGSGSTALTITDGYQNGLKSSQPVSISPTGNGGATGVSPFALFWNTAGHWTIFYPFYNSLIHHGFTDEVSGPGGGWSDTCPAITSIAPHMQRQPNAWNGESLLMPIRPIIYRPDNKISVVGELKHARYVRVDNYAPSDVITLGADTWKVFPWHKKNASARDGNSTGDHTGTLGVALRV